MKNISQTIFNLLFVLIYFLSINSTIAQYVEFTQITDDLPAQEHPAIYGDFVVFESEVTVDNHDLLLYKISTGETTTIVSDPASASANPDIFENMVVWQDNRGGDWEIYYYIIGASSQGGEPLLEWEGDQVEPAIYGDNIVFSDKKPGNTSWNIQWLQNTPGILQRLTDDTDGDQRNPDVYEDKIVWQDQRMGNWDIYMYDIDDDEFVVITDDPEAQRSPSIGEGRIVWEDFRDGDANIYMHLTTTFIDDLYYNFDWPVKVSNTHPNQNDYDQTKPQIHGDNLVFIDYRNGNQDIYLYKFYSELWGKLYQITEDTDDQRYPAVYDKYVVWQDERGWNGQDPYAADIWMWEFPPGADMLVIVQDDPDPVETNAELLYSLYVWNSGPQDAINATMTGTLPFGIDYISGKIVGGDGCLRSGDQVTCDLGDMPSGTLDTILIKVRPVDEGQISFTANVQSDEEDLVPSNNSYKVYSTVLWQFYSEIGQGYKPSFKLDGNNKIHMVYQTDSWEGDLIYATNSQGGWIRETLDENVADCKLTIDQAGAIHIAYSKFENSGQYVLKYRNKTNSIWSDVDDIASSNMGFYGLSIAYAPHDIVYVSYMENMWNAPVKLAYKSGSSWYGPLILDVFAYNDLAMVVDENGYLHFAYYAINSGPNYYTNAPDSVWKTAVEIELGWAGGQLESLNLDITLDNTGLPHVSYSGSQNDDYQENHKYARLSGGNWLYEFIEEESYSTFNTLATDENQKAHMLYYDGEEGQMHYANNTSGSWDVKIVDYNPDDYCDNEIDPLGYIHIIYSVNGALRYVTDAPPTPEPEINISPEVIDFVLRNVGDTTDTEKVVIKNTGGANLLIDEVKLIWPDSSSFSIANNTCSVIAPNDSCSIDVAFNPVSIGNKIALLQFFSNDPEDDSKAVRLEGLGVEPIVYDYGNLAFGEVLLGDSTVSIYTIKNKGNADLQIQLVAIQNDDASEFYYIDLPETPFSIPENDSIQFKLIFKPSSLGELTTQLKIFTNDLDLTRILTGTGIEPTFSIEGVVKIDDNTIVDQGTIYAIEVDENGAFTYFYFKPLEGALVFQFVGLPEGLYTMRFHPDVDAYPGFLTTYLGNTPFSYEADNFILNKDTSEIEIRLVAVPPPPEGSGEVSGNMVDEEGSGGGRIENGRYAGDGTPVENSVVYLLDVDKNIVDYDHTDGGGGFDFLNIPNGSYQFYADYKGYPMNPANEAIVLEDANQDLEIAVIVENQMISARIMSTTGLLTFAEGGFRAFPVPVTNQLTVELPRTFDAKEMRISFINTLGKKSVISTSSIRNTQRQLELDGVVQSLANGIYILVIETGNDGYFTKIIKYPY